MNKPKKKIEQPHVTDREKIIDMLREVLLAHHDDLSKSDEDACELAADKIIIMYNLDTGKGVKDE